MKYQMRVTEGQNAMLVFTRKDGSEEEIHVGYTRAGMLADRVLSELYDFHQCDNEFGPDDTMEVEGVGTFMVLEKIHIAPADEDTKLAVQGVTRALPYRVAYDGIDGHSSKSFASLTDAAAYVKERWQGIDYVDGKFGFHTDYARYTCFGFKLADIGTFSGTTREDRNFVFNQ